MHASAPRTRGRESFKAPAVAAGSAERSLGARRGPSWVDAAWTPKPHRGEGGVRTGPWAVRLPTVAEVGARVGAHGDPRPATSRSGPGRLPAPGPAVARCVTRAFPAEYCLSLAQPQPDAGEREQGLVSTGRKGIGQEKEKKNSGGCMESSSYRTRSVGWRSWEPRAPTEGPRGPTPSRPFPESYGKDAED